HRAARHVHGKIHRAHAARADSAQYTITPAYGSGETVGSERRCIGRRRIERCHYRHSSWSAAHCDLQTRLPGQSEDLSARYVTNIYTLVQSIAIDTSRKRA